MYKTFPLGLALITVLTIFGFGQAPAEKWTRIVGEKGEVSAAFPADYLVDAEKRVNSQFCRIIGYRNGVNVEMTIRNDPDSRNHLSLLSAVDGEKGVAFTINGVQGRKFSAESGTRYSERIFFASGDRLYHITVNALSSKKEELLRFLHSILVNGTPMYVRQTSDNWPEETIQVSLLTTSGAVSAVYERKYDSHQINIVYERDSKFAGYPAPATDVRPAIILERPNPDIRSMFVASRPPGMSAKLAIHFLASGQIGDITAYSSDKNFARVCVEAAKKIKFIPAKDGDKDVDSVGVQDYSAIFAGITTMVGIPRTIR